MTRFWQRGSTKYSTRNDAMMRPVVAVLVAMLAFPAFGQGRSESSRLGRGVERELLALDREWCEAVVRRDAAALDLLLAEDYTLLEPSGQVINKAEEIAYTKALEFLSTIESVKTEDVEMSVCGERAIVTGILALSVRIDGENIKRAVLVLA